MVYDLEVKCTNMIPSELQKGKSQRIIKLSFKKRESHLLFIMGIFKIYI